MPFDGVISVTLTLCRRPISAEPNICKAKWFILFYLLAKFEEDFILEEEQEKNGNYFNGFNTNFGWKHLSTNILIWNNTNNDSNSNPNDRA